MTTEVNREDAERWNILQGALVGMGMAIAIAMPKRQALSEAH